MKDVVVTGMGVVSSIGSTVDRYWSRSPRAAPASSRRRPRSSAPTGPAWRRSTAASARRNCSNNKVLAGTDRHTQMLMVAAENAREQAGPLAGAGPAPDGPGDRHLDGRPQLRHRRPVGVRGRRRAGGPEQGPDQDVAQHGAAQLAYRWKLHGPQLTLCTACASSADAVGTAARLIESGIADVAVAGGSDAHLKPVVLLSAGGLGAGSAEVDPARGLLPFDKGRSGMVVGEGAGACPRVAAARPGAGRADPRRRPRLRLARRLLPPVLAGPVGRVAGAHHVQRPGRTPAWSGRTSRGSSPTAPGRASATPPSCGPSTDTSASTPKRSWSRRRRGTSATPPARRP